MKVSNFQIERVELSLKDSEISKLKPRIAVILCLQSQEKRYVIQPRGSSCGGVRSRE